MAKTALEKKNVRRKSPKRIRKGNIFCAVDYVTFRKKVEGKTKDCRLLKLRQWYLEIRYINLAVYKPQYEISFTGKTTLFRRDFQTLTAQAVRAALSSVLRAKILLFYA